MALTLDGSGSVGVYDDDVIESNKELVLTGTDADPKPIVSSVMTPGSAWGAYTGNWSVPHAGGMNTSIDPKVLLLLYGWTENTLFTPTFGVIDSYDHEELDGGYEE